MIKYPATHEQLAQAGFRFNRTSQCRGPRCHEMIHWYVTPGGHPIPMAIVRPEKQKQYEMGDQPPATVFQPHFADCIDTKNFQKGKNGD